MLSAHVALSKLLTGRLERRRRWCDRPRCVLSLWFHKKLFVPRPFGHPISWAFGVISFYLFLRVVAQFHWFFFGVIKVIGVTLENNGPTFIELPVMWGFLKIGDHRGPLFGCFTLTWRGPHF